MAEDLRLRLVFEGKDAKRKLERFNKVMRETDDVAKRSTTSFNEFQGKLLGFGAQFASVAAIIAAEKKVFDFAREGATVLEMERRFQRLSEELGTTSDALEDRLGQATNNLVGDFEAMQQATDFLRLGLVDTEDELVRLSAVSAELGFDLNELTLALANQSKRRLDQLGISISVFNEKLDELKDQGLDTNEAFTEAFLLAAEEQVERLGSVAGTTEGEFRQFEATLDDLSNTGKTFLAVQIGPKLANLNDLIQGNIAETDTLIGSVGRLTNQYRGLLGLAPILTSGQEEIAASAKMQEAAMRDLARHGIRPVIAAANAVPTEVKTEIEIEGVDEALADLGTVKRAAQELAGVLNAMGGADFVVTPSGQLSQLPSGPGGGGRRSTSPFEAGLDPTGRAGGGPLHPLSLVGERGPELIINGVVIDAQTTRRLMQLGVTPQQKLAVAGPIGGESRGGGVSTGGGAQIVEFGGGSTSGPTRIDFGTGGGGGGGSTLTATSGGGGGATQEVSAEQTISAVAQTAAQATQQTSAQVINQMQRGERIGRGTNSRLDRVIELLDGQASADEQRSINLETTDTSRF